MSNYNQTLFNLRHYFVFSAMKNSNLEFKFHSTPHKLVHFLKIKLRSCTFGDECILDARHHYDSHLNVHGY